jgi:hypothetical protein
MLRTSLLEADCFLEGLDGVGNMPDPFVASGQKFQAGDQILKICGKAQPVDVECLEMQRDGAVAMALAREYEGHSSECVGHPCVSLAELSSPYGERSFGESPGVRKLRRHTTLSQRESEILQAVCRLHMRGSKTLLAEL